MSSEFISKNSIEIEAIVEMEDDTQLVIVKDPNEEKRVPKKSKSSNALRKIKKKKCTFVCIMCKQKFGSHLALKTHFRDHGSKIDLHGRPTDQSTLLKYPSNDTVKPNPIRCEYCPAIFPNISTALGHKFRKHKEMGNSFCEFCGMLFPLKFLLEQHIEKTHSEKMSHNNGDSLEKSKRADEKPTNNQKYSCTFCNANFVTIKALNFHIHGAHKVSYELIMSPIYVPPPSTKIKLNNAFEAHSVYYCHLCGIEYIVKHNLRKHIRESHPILERNTVPEKIIRCKTCEAIFYSQKAYESHLTFHSPADWYVSSEEQRGKVISRVDQDFDIRRVPPKGEELVNNAVNKKWRRRPQGKPSTSSKFEKLCEISDDESLSPPSTPSDSEDEQISKVPKISAFQQKHASNKVAVTNKTNPAADEATSKITEAAGHIKTYSNKSRLS